MVFISYFCAVVFCESSKVLRFPKFHRRRRLHSTVALLLHLLPLELLRGLLLLGLGLVVITAFDDDVVLLRQDELDVARRRHVGVDAPVSAVRPAPHLRRPIHLDVGDDEVVDVETLVVGVRFGVLQEREQEFGGLLGPTTLGTGSVPGLGLGVATGSAHVAPEGHDFLQLADVLEESGGALERHVPDGSGGLARVLVMHAQVGATRLDRLGRVFRFRRVTSHLIRLGKRSLS